MSSAITKVPVTVGADPSRRLALRRLWALFTGLTAIGGTSALLDGCGGGGDETSGGPPTDGTPPTIFATSPASNATGVARDSSVSVTFSEPLNNATLNGSFTLAPTAGGTAIAGTVNVSGNTATFAPSASLAGSTQYTATITTAAQDAAGNALVANFTWRFTTVTPTLGAHNLVFLKLADNMDARSTDLMNTQTSGSTILACVGRGSITQHVPPADNMGNTPVQLDTAHIYTQWPGSGTALYAITSAAGGSGHVIAAANLPNPVDEVTLAVVEVMNGGVVQDVKWNEVLAAPLTSLSVTTTGPATLVAFWWGDAGELGDKTATPSDGFVVCDAILDEGALVQCAVATKDVSSAGDYSVTWDATPLQGAQLWLVAVQSQPAP